MSSTTDITGEHHKEPGVYMWDELAGKPGIPSRERMNKGPVAVIECCEEIPCNPCEAACPLGAIKVGPDIRKLPTLDEDVCVGCGACVPRCPGMAIFVINMAYSDSECSISFPYEYQPLPQACHEAEATDRCGKVVGEARVLKVDVGPKNDRTAVITIAVPKSLAYDVRGIKLGGRR